MTSSASLEPCLSECGWFTVSCGGGAGTLTFAWITYTNGIILTLLVQEVLKYFCPLDDWKCLGYLWHLWIIILLLVLQHHPLNIKVLHYMCPSHVGCCQVSAHCIVVLDKVTSHKKPLPVFCTKCKGRHWNSCSSGSIGAWVGDPSS